MTTVSKTTTTVFSNTLGTRTADQLLADLDASEVVFELRNSFRIDCFTAVVAACALSRGPRRIALNLPAEGLSDGVEESLARSLLGPLVWRSTRPSPGVDASDQMLADPLAHVDRERTSFVVSCSLLDSRTRERFLADLSLCMLAAGISIDKEVLGSVAALTYEANANAEEHGSTRLTEAKTFDKREVFRCFAMRLHSEPGTALAASTASYLADYHRHFSTRTRWLEVVVGDAGMGITYPRFLVRARSAHSSITDVYEASHSAELGQMDELLSKAVSTKGYWGSARSNYGSAGEGISQMKRRLVGLRAFGAVRAGRCLATISCARPAFSQSQMRRVEYTIDQSERPLFLGTVWHLLIPLDQQHELPF